jgi:hypothetical protein
MNNSKYTTNNNEYTIRHFKISLSIFCLFPCSHLCVLQDFEGGGSGEIREFSVFSVARFKKERLWN